MLAFEFLAFEFVADPAHGEQQFRLGGGRLQLFAQPANMHVDRAVVHIAVLAPDPRQQGLAVKDAALVGGQQVQQIKLFAGQGDRRAVLQNLALAGPDFHAADVQGVVFFGSRLRRRLRAAAAQGENAPAPSARAWKTV